MRKIFLLLLFIFLCSCGGQTIYEKHEIPRNLSWASMDLDGDGVGENYITSIKKQPCMDCYIYSALGLLEIQYQIDHGINVSLDLSEQNIHNCLRISCSSTGDERSIYEYIKKYGVMEEHYSKSGNWRLCENCSKRVSTKSGVVDISHIPFYKIKGWRLITNSLVKYEDRKLLLVLALQNGPVVIQSRWGYRFNDGIGYCINEKAGFHSTIIIGYVNYGEAFLVKNSHNENDMLRIPFEGSDKCDFASVATQIISTYTEWGSGEDFCYSMDDLDKDGVPDAHDNCPKNKNTNQINTDSDMLGDVCDPCPKDGDPNGYYCK